MPPWQHTRKNLGFPAEPFGRIHRILEWVPVQQIIRQYIQVVAADYDGLLLIAGIWRRLEGHNSSILE